MELIQGGKNADRSADPNSREATQDRIESCIPLVHHHANRISTLYPGLDKDDLVGAGLLGLVQAAQGFQDNKGAKFSTFVGFRIRGAMLDSVRKSLPLSRRVARLTREYRAALANVSMRLSRVPTDAEMGVELDVTVEHIEMIRQAQRHIVSLEQQIEDGADFFADEGDSLEDEVFGKLEREDLHRLLMLLPQRDRQILKRIYMENVSYKNIGSEIGISESRISQINKGALMHLRRLAMAENAA